MRIGAFSSLTRTWRAASPSTAAGNAKHAPAPRSARPKPTFSAEYLEWLREARNPGSTTLEDRLAVANSLVKKLGPRDAAQAACFLAEMSSGRGGCNYTVGNDFEVSVQYTSPRPLEEVTREFHEVLEKVRHTRPRPNGGVGQGDVNKAMFAQAVMTTVLADRAQDYLSLLHDYGDPHAAYNLCLMLSQVPAEHRTAARRAIERDYTHDETGEPRPWPAGDWYNNSKRLLFMASLLEPGQSFQEARDAVGRLGPKIDALDEAEKLVFFQHKPTDERHRYAAVNYRDPGESAIRSLERQFELIGKLNKRGLKVVDQRGCVDHLSHKLDFWRGVMPGQSAQTILDTVVDAVVGARIPSQRLGPLVRRLESHMQSGETPLQAVARLERMHDALEGRMAKYGEQAMNGAFEASVALPGAPPLLLADVADRLAERHDASKLTDSSFYYAAREHYQSGDTPEALLARLEHDHAYTGSFNGLRQLHASFNRLEQEGKVTPERRRELEEQAPGWLTGFKLTGYLQPDRKMLEALSADPSCDLSKVVKNDLVARLEVPGRALHAMLADVGAALGECNRLGKRMGYSEAALLEAMQSAIREAGPEGALALPALLEELAAGNKAPKAEELPDMARAAVAKAAAGQLLANLPLEKRLELVAHSHYLTGSFQGLQKASERLETWQNAGTLRQDVPFKHLYEVLEKHILQLRVTGTPAERTVEAAFERLRESEYSSEGSLFGQTLGMVGERLAIGAVPLKIRRRTW